MEITAKNIAKANVKNVVLHDANESSETYDLVTTFNILHDCTHPKGLIAQVKAALHIVEPETGTRLLSDGPASSRESCKKAYGRNILAFFTCLCMSCAPSVEGGAVLGTLEFSVPVANKLLKVRCSKKVEKRW